MGTNFISEDIVRFHLMETCKRDGLCNFCRKHNLNPGNISNMINHKKPLMKSALVALGYEKVVMYKKTNK